MTYEDEKIYLDTLDNIVDKVYDFYNLSDREDLIMVYEMKENIIYSYIYDDYLKRLNERSREMLEEQYQKAIDSKRIVLFIRDEERKKLKSYII